jgi:alkylhydroperoxidase family enzyme
MKNALQDGPFLAPIEEPKDLETKQAYDFYLKTFGKVITPVKVFSARMPAAFGRFSAQISELDKQLELPAETVMLVREQVARLNVCLFCMDIGRASVIRYSMNEAKFDDLDHYTTSLLFTDGEKAVLDYVTELTRDKKVDPEVFKRMRGYYSERQVCEIVYLVASEHVYNMTNIGLNIHSDMLCDISKKKKMG